MSVRSSYAGILAEIYKYGNKWSQFALFIQELLITPNSVYDYSAIQIMGFLKFI